MRLTGNVWEYLLYIDLQLCRNWKMCISKITLSSILENLTLANLLAKMANYQISSKKENVIINVSDHTEMLKLNMWFSLQNLCINKAFLHKHFSVLHSIFLAYKELISILTDEKYLEYFLTSAECYFCTGIIIMKYFCLLILLHSKHSWFWISQSKLPPKSIWRH